MSFYEAIFTIVGLSIIIIFVIIIIIFNFLSNRIQESINNYEIGKKYFEQGDKEKALYYYRLWESQSNKKWWEF